MISEWDLRRLYNEGDVKKLASQGEYDIRVKFGKPRGATKRIPAGSRSVKTRYFDKTTGVQVADFHHYEGPDGKRITRFDPKFLLLDGVEYHRRGEGEPEPSRLRNSEINTILHKHGLDARITYVYKGWEQTKKWWKLQVRNRLVKLGILESRDWMLV